MNKNHKPFDIGNYLDALVDDDMPWLEEIRKQLIKVQTNLDEAGKSSEFQTVVNKDVFFNLIREINMTVANVSNIKSSMYLLENILTTTLTEQAMIMHHMRGDTSNNLPKDLMDLVNGQKSPNGISPKKRHKIVETEEEEEEEDDETLNNNEHLTNALDYLKKRVSNLENNKSDKKRSDTDDAEGDE